jgi:hypothetical protein
MTTTKSSVGSGTAIAAKRRRGGGLSEDFPAHLAGFQAGSLVAGYRLEAQVGAGWKRRSGPAGWRWYSARAMSGSAGWWP